MKEITQEVYNHHKALIQNREKSPLLEKLKQAESVEIWIGMLLDRKRFEDRDAVIYAAIDVLMDKIAEDDSKLPREPIDEDIMQAQFEVMLKNI